MNGKELRNSSAVQEQRQRLGAMIYASVVEGTDFVN